MAGGVEFDHVRFVAIDAVAVDVRHAGRAGRGRQRGRKRVSVNVGGAVLGVLGDAASARSASSSAGSARRSRVRMLGLSAAEQARAQRDERRTDWNVAEHSPAFSRTGRAAEASSGAIVPHTDRACALGRVFGKSSLCADVLLAAPRSSGIAATKRRLPRMGSGFEPARFVDTEHQVQILHGGPGRTFARGCRAARRSRSAARDRRRTAPGGSCRCTRSDSESRLPTVIRSRAAERRRSARPDSARTKLRARLWASASSAASA